MHESNVEFSRNSWIRILRTASGLTIEQYLEKLRGLVLLAKEHDLEVRVNFDLGGTASTKEVTREVIKNYREIYDHS